MSLKLKDIFPKLIRDIKSIEKEVINKGWKEASRLMQEDIVKSIERGVSPIDGHKRFEKYSDSYSDAIKDGKIPGKKVRPVNLKASGKMLESIFSKKTSKGFETGFEKTVKGKNLADIHSNQGASKKKVKRPIIPTDNGDYKRSIKKRAEEYLKQVTSDVLAKLLRRF